IALAGVDMYRRISASAETKALTPLSGGEKGLIALGVLVPILVGFIAAALLSTLSVARQKGSDANNAMNLKMMQVGLEIYYSSKDAYPASLQDMTAELPPGTNID